MFQHTATLQSAFEKTATAFDFACTVADRLYWLDDHYVQPFYAWAAPRLRDVALSGLYWGLVTLIDVALWLTDTTLQFMARDAQAIALVAFAQDHPHPELPALPPAAVPLALPAALPMAPDGGLTADNDVDRVIIIYPTVVPFAFNQFLAPDNSVRRWLTAALPLVPSLTLESAPVVAEVTETVEVLQVVPVAPVPKPRKAKDNAAGTTDTAKTPRKRSPKKTTTAR